MIKLIATDMDGTLVTSKKELPTEIFSLINELKKRDIKFVVASGRQYFNLKGVFNDNITDIIYIAENGAVIYENGENIYADIMEEEVFTRLIEPIRKTKNAFPVFCGIKSAYIEDSDEEFVKNAKMYFKLETVSNIMDALKVDRICKISIFDKVKAENAYSGVEKYCNNVQIVVSSKDWVDITNVGTNKGRAIEILQKKINIKREECMSFGDYLNDLELIESCNYSFAMENAHPIIKEKALYKTKSNDEKGVIHTIQAFLNNELDEILK